MKNRNILPYVGLTLRIIMGVFAITIAVLFFIEMTKTATTRLTYGLCFLVPVFAVLIVFGDIYMRYKLDIKPLRNKKGQE